MSSSGFSLRLVTDRQCLRHHESKALAFGHDNYSVCSNLYALASSKLCTAVTVKKDAWLLWNRNNMIYQRSAADLHALKYTDVAYT